VKTTDVFSWAHGIGPSGRRPSSVTIGARIACLSSFYRFLIRMGLVQANTCKAIERPKTTAGRARGMTAEEIQKLLAVIPATPTGLRARSIVLTLVFTARRRAEVMGLKVGNLIREGESVQYTYRGKGGKTGKRQLPGPAYHAILNGGAAPEPRPTRLMPVPKPQSEGGADDVRSVSGSPAGSGRNGHLHCISFMHSWTPARSVPAPGASGCSSPWTPGRR
jgi:integrase